jgi:hypothetical protein
VEELERTRVGPYTADQAVRVCDLRRGGPLTQSP